MVRHLASIAEVVDDMEAAVRFYRHVLGLEVDHESGSGYGVVHLPGILHYGLWSRAEAANSTFGDPSKADGIPLGFSVGFEVDSVTEDSRHLEAQGWPLAQEPKTEPWGQKTSRFFSASGALCEIAETPWARRISKDMSVEGDS